MLVGGDWNHGMDYDFLYIGNFIIPTDELIFFRVVAQPPTIGSLTDVFLGKWGNIWAIVGSGCFIMKAKEFTRKL